MECRPRGAIIGAIRNVAYDFPFFPMFGILKKGFGAVAIMAVCASAMEVSAQARYAETVKFDDGTSRTLNYHT